MFVLRIMLLAIALSLPGMLYPAVIHIPGDQPTIQAGIDAAVDGDTVLVADGVYTGDGNRDVEFGDKAITVKSENGPESCIIDCEGSEFEPHRGFIFDSSFQEDAVLQGFTIKNGYVVSPDNHGGGILCLGFESSPTIIDNIITVNRAVYGGGVACLNSSEPLIVNNQIHGNYAAGIYCNGASPTIHSNILSDNSSRGVIYYGGSPTITDNIITDNVEGGIGCSDSVSTIYGNIIFSNTGSGIYINEGFCVIANNLIKGNKALGPEPKFGGGIWCEWTETPTQIIGNTIVDNIAGARGGGIYIAHGAKAIITDTILWNNHASNGNDIYIKYGYGGFAGAQIGYSVVDGGPASVFVDQWCFLIVGDGMIDVDPLFVGGPMGDYYLSQIAAGQAEDSPCIDAGDPESEMVWGITRTDNVHDTGVVDMGFHYPWKSVSAQLACIPASGTLPFQAKFGIQLSNNFIESERLIAAQIDLALASGLEIPSWRAGTIIIGPDDSFSTVFNSFIPMLPQVVGENTFTLLAEDVTPAPFNQPPYPPSGDVDESDCTVTGIAP